MRRMLLALALALSVFGCTSTYSPIVADPAPKSTRPPAKPRLLEQDIGLDDYKIPVLHATIDEFLTYRKELATAPLASRRATRGIICYASIDDSLDHTLLARIAELYGEAMAKECGSGALTHWGSASVTRCFVDAGAVAHCHSDGVICIITDQYRSGIMRHEILHAFSFSKRLDERKVWRLAWLETLYVGHSWSTLPERLVFPRDGFVSAYATKHHDEDIAEVVMAAYLFAHRDTLHEHDPYLGAPLSDPRWRAKLKTAYGFSAITDEEYGASIVRLTPP